MKNIIRLFALILCVCQLLAAVSCGVEPDITDEYTLQVTEPATEPATEPPATEPPATEPPATEPPATEPPATEPPATEPPATEPPVTEPPVTEAPVIEVPMPELTELPADGTLIYYENFDGIATTYSGDSLIAKLGWEKPNKAGGVSSNATAVLSLKSLNGGKALYVTNYASGNDGSDSYFSIISGDKFKYFADHAYTVQYDLKYTDASKADRYINIITDFGGTYYNSFHLRNGGYAHNQYYLAGKWYNFEDSNYTAKSSSTSKTSQTTIAYKLLGKYYDGTQLLSGINLSVRCVYEPERGTSMYVRVNDAGYPASGKWVAVSAIKDGVKGSVLPNSEFGGGGILLKVGGKQTRYVDNIAISLATGDEPADKSVQYLDSAKCHKYTEKDGEAVCFICGESYKNIEGDVWQLTFAPEYEGGELSESAYYAGASALDKDFKLQNDSKMQLIAQTSKAEFTAYLNKLEAEGLSREFYREENGNIYASYRFAEGKNKGKRIYTYYYTIDKTARVVEEYAVSISAEEFGYAYEKQAGDTTQFYQYGLSSTSVGHGMLCIIKCADNSVIIIDGGSYQHFDAVESENLMRLLRDITCVASPEKVRISAWIITHGHSDHLGGFSVFLGHKGEQVVIERVMYNLPSVYTYHGLFTAVRSETEKMYGYMAKSAPLASIDFYNFHTGEQLRIADVEIDIVYTHEDLVDAKTGKSGIAGDFNNSCSVFTVRMDGYNILITGDINKPAAPIIVRNQRTALNDAKAVQTAHHLLNDIRTMYSVIKPETVFIPAPVSRPTKSELNKQLYALLKQTAGDEIYLQGDATTGFEVKNGKLVKIYEKKALGTKYTDWTW